MDAKSKHFQEQFLVANTTGVFRFCLTSLGLKFAFSQLSQNASMSQPCSIWFQNRTLRTDGHAQGVPKSDAQYIWWYHWNNLFLDDTLIVSEGDVSIQNKSVEEVLQRISKLVRLRN